MGYNDSIKIRNFDLKKKDIENMVRPPNNDGKYIYIDKRQIY